VLPLDDDVPVFWQSDAELIALDDALRMLEGMDARLAAVVECRFFGGYDDAETGRLLGMTDRTVRRDWVKARALLRTLLEDGELPGPL
jgi:DNA-directed RNA polymerase specialized sigma24 family protein